MDLVYAEIRFVQATLTVLAQKIRFQHWNLRSDLFFDLHAQFGSLYAELNDWIDDYAERLRTLGRVPSYKFSDLESFSVVTMSVLEEQQPVRMAMATVIDMKRLLDTLRSLVGHAVAESDWGTEVMAKETISKLEKWVWKFSSFAEPEVE